MAKNPPLIGEIVPKQEIDSIISLLGKDGYLAVYDGRKTVIAEVGSRVYCVFTEIKERSGQQHSLTCTEETDISSRISALLSDQDEGKWQGIEDIRPCRGVTLHYFFRVPDGFDGNRRRIRTVGLIFLGPVINSTEIPDPVETFRALSGDADKLSDQAILRPLRPIPRLSEAEIRVLEAQGKLCAGILSRRYQEAVSRRQVWVAMPFASEFNDVYNFGIVPAVTQLRYKPVRVDHLHPDKEIMKEIRDGVDTSAFVVADVSGNNPNVMYEVGLGDHAAKTVLLITRGQPPFPFPVAGKNIIQYTPGNLAPLINKIQECVRSWQDQGKIPCDYE